MSVERLAKVAGFLEWIAPEDGLESMAAERSFEAEIEETPWASGEEAVRAGEAVGRLHRGEALSVEDAAAIEAIVLPRERPVVDIVNGTYTAPAAPFAHLDKAAARKTIEGVIPSIGRIELPDHPSLPYGGTGFVVGQGVLMTNRHVAELFALGLGSEQLSFRPGRTAAIDFRRERDSEESLLFEVTRVLMVHPYWDMALLATQGLGDVEPLSLSTAAPGELREREIVVVGYPALDPRNNVELQTRIFGGVFNVKRLQPGKLRAMGEIDSFDHTVSAVTHDSSTLGGNSGSALIDVETGKVVGLHFAGRYLEANYAVPTHELALDRRVVDAQVNFDDEIAGTGAPAWDSFWDDADPRPSEAGLADLSGEPEQLSGGATLALGSGGEGLSWSIPLELTVEIRGQGSGPLVPRAPESAVEAMVEPFRDRDFSGRRGYNDRFLGIRVPLPRVLDDTGVSHLDDGSHVLPYEHFSVVVNKVRRLALFTASNVEADARHKAPEPGRDYTRKGLTGLGKNDQEKWFTDPRIPADQQLPDRFFTKDRKSFDKGHIVRREDVAWGNSFDEVRRANGDTFHVTNCSPQVSGFNRSVEKGLWGQLENLILKQAKTERYCVFAGPVLRPDDRIFRGVDDDGEIRVAIPRQFWKIVVARSGDELQTFAFCLDQDLSDTDLEFAVDELWTSRMISVADLERLLGELSLPEQLHESDQFDSGGGEAVRARMESFPAAGR
jgi:endonuclease G, mitochondrial